MANAEHKLKIVHLMNIFRRETDAQHPMYSGELQSVTMRFPNNMVGTVLDRFGREVTLMKADDRHFRITVPIAVSPQFYGWVFGLKNMVTIESPQSVVDGVKEMLPAVEKRYEDSKGSQ